MLVMESMEVRIGPVQPAKPRPQARVTHQPFNRPPADATAMDLQCLMHPGTAVRPTAGRKDFADLSQQHPVLFLPRARAPPLSAGWPIRLRPSRSRRV